MIFRMPTAFEDFTTPIITIPILAFRSIMDMDGAFLIIPATDGIRGTGIHGITILIIIHGVILLIITTHGIIMADILITAHTTIIIRDIHIITTIETIGLKTVAGRAGQILLTAVVV